MLIVADIAALVISSYIYFTYDRNAAAVVSSLDGTSECSCRVTVKPPCCRLSMFQAVMVTLAVLLSTFIVIILPDAYYRYHGR